MAASDEFVDYVVEQLSGWGEVSVRRMFGGAGLYREGTMFAVVADDVAYLKVDDSNRDDFLRAGSAPFEPYPDKIKTTIRTYFEIPAGCAGRLGGTRQVGTAILDRRPTKEIGLGARHGAATSTPCEQSLSFAVSASW